MTAKDGKPCKRCGTSEWSNRGECKKCSSEYYRRWREANREKHLEATREWRVANPQRVKDQRKKWKADNKEKVSEGARRWRSGLDKQAKEAQRRQQREWKRRNPGKRVADNNRRRTRETEAGGFYTVAEFKELCNHYGNKCLRCGRDDVKLTADHIKPVSKGGSSNIDNIQPLCLPCNSSKHDRHIDYRPDAGPLRWLQCKLFG